MNTVLMQHLEDAKTEIIENGTDTKHDIANQMLNHLFKAIELLKEGDRAFEIQSEETRRSNYLKTFTERDCRMFFPEEYIKRLVDATVGDAKFIYKDEMWRAYKDDCHHRGKTPMERQCLNAAMYTYGYQDYFFYAKPSWWRPGTLKPKRGKRAKNNRTS